MGYCIWNIAFWSYISLLSEAAWRVPILACLQVRIKRRLSRTDTQSQNLQENRDGIKVPLEIFFSDTEGKLERLRRRQNEHKTDKKKFMKCVESLISIWNSGIFLVLLSTYIRTLAM